jgi:hypothetical protein
VPPKKEKTERKVKGWMCSSVAELACVRPWVWFPELKKKKNLVKMRCSKGTENSHI